MIKPKIDNIFKPLYTSSKRYFFLTGGRGSTKTYSVHDFVAKLTYERGHGILFTRYTMTSAEKSVIPEFRMTLERLGITEDFHITKTTATNLKTGSFIFFSGIKTSQGDQTANLKSLPNITTWIIEEGEDFNDEKTFDSIDDSIRQKGIHNRVIWIMNPTTTEHFIYHRWVIDWGKQIEIDGIKVMVGNHPEVENIHSTYLIATKYLSHSFLKKAWKWRTRAKEGYCPIEKRELSEVEHEKAKKWYLGNYLGGWRDRAEGAIYDNWEIGEFNDSLPYVYGLDFGSNDPDAITKVAVDEDNKKIYIDEVYFKNNTSTGQLIKIIHDRIGTQDLIIADSAERRLINDFYQGMYGSDGNWYSGVNIRKVRKSKGVKLNFVARRIKIVQSYTLVVTPSSKNVIKALKNYVWHDSRAGVPKHDYSDLCDSFGYAAIDMIEY
jgi:phage terminase large subunit